MNTLTEAVLTAIREAEAHAKVNFRMSGSAAEDWILTDEGKIILHYWRETSPPSWRLQMIVVQDRP